MCLFKNRFETLTREEVVDTICTLEREESQCEDSIAMITEKIKGMMDEGIVKNDDPDLLAVELTAPAVLQIETIRSGVRQTGTSGTDYE